jgi:anion-transporting  ArsA/GET3 family ATPase
VRLEHLLATKEIAVVCGPGGVGKTSCSAAAGLAVARHVGGKVLVLTVDPARRLATAMGLESLGNRAVQVPPAALADAGIELRGELWAAQLDTKASWDDLIVASAPDRATRDAILGNQIYEQISSRFVQSHDYIAMERLHELHSSGAYDLIVVDTPPSRSAIDFLDAPERMAEFFSSRLLRWLTVPYRSKVFGAASRPFYSVADRILGQQFLRDIADFFILFQTLHKGFVERANEVQRTLQDRRTTFAVVSTLEPSALREAEYFMSELGQRDLHLGALVLNRVLPDNLRRRAAGPVARRLADDGVSVAHALVGVAPDFADEAMVARVLTEVGERFLDHRLSATRQSELRRELQAGPELTASVPIFTDDISDLAGLARMGDHL